MRKTIIYAISLILSMVFFVKADTCSLKELGEGRYIIENEYLEVEVNALAGGSIGNIIYKPQKISLTGVSTGSKSKISLEDRIYKQSYKGNEKVVDLEYFSKYPYSVKILSNTKTEVSLEVSFQGLSDIFAGLIVSKTYTLKDKVPALFIEHRLENVSNQPVETGIWSTNYFRIAGLLPERNKYYTPTTEGLQEVLHPGKDAAPGAIWTLSPSSNWKGIVGETSRSGVVIIFEEKDLSNFMDWHSIEKTSTFEWVINQQKLNPKDIFKTRYVIMPVEGYDRIDDVMGSRIVCSIEYPDAQIKIGEEVEVRYKLTGYENDVLKLRAKIKSGEKTLKESVLDKVKLEAGKSFIGSIKQKILTEGVYWIEVEVFKDNKLLGITKRPLVVGNFKAETKVTSLVKRRPEENFWFALKATGMPEWKDVKLVAHNILSKPGGREVEKNLVTMGDFEEKDIKKYKDWRFIPGTTLTEEASHSGKQSLKIIVPQDYKGETTSFRTPLIKVEGGKEYRVSFWAKATDATGSKPTKSPARFWYVLYPCSYYYKGSQKAPQYINRSCEMIKTPTFDWQKIEKILKMPEDAEWINFSISTKATMGDIYIDDISITLAPLSDKAKREERARYYNPSLDIYFNVSKEYETPHIKWLKPYSKGKIKTLYMSSMNRLDDMNKRDVIELDQRLDIDYKFIPLLSKSEGEAGHIYLSGKELEPYIVDIVKEEINKEDYNLFIINKFDFKIMQKEVVQDLLTQVKNGKGLLMIDCKNIPSEINSLLTRANLVKTPDDFINMPEINRSLKSARQVPQICKIWKVDKGKVATVILRGNIYPCVPAVAPGMIEEFYPNYYGREIPYWEYKMFPLIKAATYLSGKESDIKINNFLLKEDMLNVKIQSNRETEVFLEIRFKDKYGQEEKFERYPLKLQKGDNAPAIPLLKLSGGLHLADYRLTSSKDGLIYDFGSYAFDVPLVSEIKEINFAQSNPCYRSGEEIKTKIILQNVTASSSLSWYVEDVYNRIIEKGNQPLKKGQEVADVNFKINYPLGILYRLFVKLDKSGEIQDISMGEFSMPFNFPPDDELMGYGWITAHGAHGFKMWKDNGFDVNMASGYNLYKRGMFKAMCNVNMRPCLNGVMYFAGDPDVGWRYRGDLGKEGDDTVRKPCYSDPSYWNKVKEEITLKLKDREMLYYGIKDYHIGDECFLGTNVCYSEWCLKDFRDYLRKEYNRLSSLNNTWKTNYKSWEEVTPIQLKGVDTKKNNMAAWLDHKMFMTTVFARLGERIKSIIREESAGMEIRVGFSGMQNPGFSYNWEEMTKHLTLLRHYGGMQVDLVRSLHQPGTRYGRPTGYSSAYINAEKSVKYHIWRQIFNNANSVMIYHGGCALLGDLTLADNTKYLTGELLEAKKGLDKMLLSSELVCPIGIHYSHSSLFAGRATLGANIWPGALDSWSAIINDLGLNFKFVSYKQLEEGIDRNQYKVFVLPISLCLSDNEINSLRKYVASGGVLVADYGVGIYNEHGEKRNNKLLNELFGISREESSEIVLSGSGIKIRNAKIEGLEDREMKLRFGEKGLKLTTSKAYGYTGDTKAPAVIINKFGRGKTIFLNSVINDYAQVTLSGGGEISATKRGVLEINEQTKGLARDVFKIGEIVPEVLIKTDKGVDLQSTTKTSIWQNGKIKYVGLLNEPESMSGGIKSSDAIGVNILFSQKGHLYDVREKKYIGEISKDKEIKTNIIPAVAKIYAIMPYKIVGLDVKLNKKNYKVGEIINLPVKVKVSGQAGTHIVYAEVYGPDKEVRNYYSQKVVLEKGEGVIKIPTAFNDPTGDWSIMLRDVASGNSQKVNIILTK